LNNDLARLEREQRRFEKAERRHAARLAHLSQAPEAVRNRVQPNEPRVRAVDQDRFAQLARLRQLAAQLHDLDVRVCLLEDEALQALYAGAGTETFSPADLVAALEPLRQEWHDLLLTLYCRDFPNPDAVTLLLFSEDHAWLRELTAGYLGV